MTETSSQRDERRAKVCMNIQNLYTGHGYVDMGEIARAIAASDAAAGMDYDALRKLVDELAGALAIVTETYWGVDHDHNGDRGHPPECIVYARAALAKLQEPSNG